ncbi:MAG TPA: DUF2330 domain-containing protein [Polyangiaceae bacterium]|nr:DUF2330 domain-containing protein [Polyangiaceae bacterium]
MSFKTHCVGLTLFGLGLFSEPAFACGGFFCDSAQPVNQAAERIVFADNGDGTVTAVIQIQYEGPSKSFSWLLPISTAPKGDQIQVASDLAFTRLQNATNPNYQLSTRVEGECRQEDFSDDDATGAEDGAFADAGAAYEPEPGSVNVEASGTIGPYDWTVISVTDGTDMPATVAVDWLTQNEYDVPEGAAQLLGPYLEDGLFLLAIRLTKDADSGSIRPIVLTYDADAPIIPIKLTAVAANDDMGVLTWLLGTGRGVPQNYLSLELNEARINWFNAQSNYNDVVNAAADDGGGQGFVTEYSDSGATLREVVWADWEQTQWDDLSTRQYSGFGEMFDVAYATYAGYDGFWDAVKTSVSLPPDVSLEDFKLCPDCYESDIEFSPAAFRDALDANVIEPMRVVQALIDDHPTITRLYTTMSAPDMTLDPLFTFNPDLDPVSNLHNAERVIECAPSVYQSEAPWRIELPQGGVVRGTAADAASRTWPVALDGLPANRTIRRQGKSGSGKLIEDNSDTILKKLMAYNLTVPSAPDHYADGGSFELDASAVNNGSETESQDASADGTETSGGPTSAHPGPSTKPTKPTKPSGEQDAAPESTDVPHNDSGGCGCRLTREHESSPSRLGAALFLAGLALVRRRGRV